MKHVFTILFQGLFKYVNLRSVVFIEKKQDGKGLTVYLFLLYAPHYLDLLFEQIKLRLIKLIIL